MSGSRKKRRQRVFLFCHQRRRVLYAYVQTCILASYSLLPETQSAEAAQLRRGEPVPAASGRPGGDGEHPAGVRAAKPLLHVSRRRFGFPGTSIYVTNVDIFPKK